MVTLAQLSEFFGWAALLNIGILSFFSILLITMKSKIASIHSKMFAISEQEISVCYFNYLANYKVLTTVFTITPYLALKIMGH